MTDTKYAIIIDSGSSGSRVFVYSYTLSSTKNELPPINLVTTKKTSKGLSTYSDKIDLIWSEHFSPLIEHAKTNIPEDQYDDTPIFVLATAGMRLLPDKQRESVLSEVCQSFDNYSGLGSNLGSLNGARCFEMVRVVDGEEEGLWGWIALNYLTDKLLPGDKNLPYGFMDMGGASTQIAFVPSSSKELENYLEDLHIISLRTTTGDGFSWPVFVSSWLGFGANEARRRELESLIHALPTVPNNIYDIDGDGKDDLVDPCSPPGMKIDYDYNGKTYTITGSGNYEGCLRTIYPLLLKHLPCTKEPCLFNGVHAPGMDFSKEKFVGVSEYWYTAHDVFHLGGDYEYKKFEKATKEFCTTNWESLMARLEDGEFGPAIGEAGLRRACFKASWIVNVLHEGFNLPREGIDDDSSDDEIEPEPVFKSIKDIDGDELSWTLGKMVLYASSQAPGDSDVGVFTGSIKDIPNAITHNSDNNSDLKNGVSGDHFVNKADSFNLMNSLLLIGFLFIVGYFWILRRYGGLKKFLKRYRQFSTAILRREGSQEWIAMEEGRCFLSPSPCNLPRENTNGSHLNDERTLRTRSTVNLNEIRNMDENEEHNNIRSNLKQSLTFATFADISNVGNKLSFQRGMGIKPNILGANFSLGSSTSLNKMTNGQRED